MSGYVSDFNQGFGVRFDLDFCVRFNLDFCVRFCLGFWWQVVIGVLVSGLLHHVKYIQNMLVQAVYQYVVACTCRQAPVLSGR